HTGFYLAIKGTLGAGCLGIKMVREKLGPIFADENIKKIGQNIKYDMLILKNAGLELKGIFFDTMVASYCLDPERRSHSMNEMAKDFLHYDCMPISALIGKGKNQLTFDMVDAQTACEYSAEDADITVQLYEYLNRLLEKQSGLKELFETVEMPLVSCLMQMEYNGVSLDMRLLKRMSCELAEQLHGLSEKIYEHAGSVFNIDSPAQLAGILFDRLGLRSVRIGKTGRSTDASVLEELIDQHPVIELILQYRQLSKLQNTYVDKLGILINPRTGRLHTSFNQTVTATGRLSSSDPNLQNIPIRTEFGKKIRGAFIPAEKGDCILSADYSQIELRLLAHFSKDAALRKAFAEDRDIHSFVASQIYNVPIEQVTDKMRSSCKAVNFGIIYGQGAFGLSRTIGISQSEAKQFIDDYFKRYSSIRQFMDNVVASAKQTGYAETILHRQRKIADIKSKSATKQSQARRLAINTVVQGSAADLIKVAMINIQRKINQKNLPVKMILQVHDELVFELPETQAKEYAKWISDEMTSAIKLDVPLKVDISYGPSWLAGE
ncbi:MAG: DNA polymerase I, partial [Phycisphaerae bacterium]|nr:DNA polymerase I [Phycisphaerae bacterium]